VLDAQDARSEDERDDHTEQQQHQEHGLPPPRGCRRDGVPVGDPVQPFRGQ
jgi:hypothetical protein